MAKRALPPQDSPGWFMQQAMDARGWTQRDLAGVLGKPLPLVNDLIQAKRQLTTETAVELSVALGDDPTVWLKREIDYRVLQIAEQQAAVRRRAELQSVVPWRELVRRGWIPNSTDMDTVVQDVCEFLGVKSIGDAPEWSAQFRKGDGYANQTPVQLAWCARARAIAERQKVGRFRPGRLREGVALIRDLLETEGGLTAIPARLAELGVRFVVVRHLPKTRIDGATMWLSKSKSQPLIAMSLRYDRIDYFAFTLLHELSHVIEQDDPSFDTEILANAPGLPEPEIRANRFAAETLVDPSDLDGLLRQTFGNPTLAAIVDLARRTKTHPGVIVGQLQFRGILRYSSFRQTLAPIRERLGQVLTLDGWTEAPEE